MTINEEFMKLFQGNPEAHYTFQPKREPLEYMVVNRGVTADDIEKHLGGQQPSLLSIPILPSGLCHFACGDCDRHMEDDPAIDHVEVARKITEFGLPLVITRSKSPKSAHIWLFLKDKDGFSSVIARKLIEKYMRVLGIEGKIEVFPKQEVLGEDPVTHEIKKGSGINLPYFSNARIGFGKDGEELNPEEFLKLAHARQAFGKILRDRDLADNPEAEEPKDKTDRPLPIEIIRSIHEKNLQTLRDSNTAGHWNDILNTTAFFAARAFAAKALEGTAHEVKTAIEKAASAIDGWNERKMHSTFNSGWESGIKKPLLILDPEKEHDQAVNKIQDWQESKFDLAVEDVYFYLSRHTDEEYQLLRADIAKGMGIQVAKLDEFVRKRRQKEIKESNSQVEFKPSAAWPDAVNGAELLADIAATLRRFIVFKNKLDAEVMATWSLGTYLYEEFSIFSRLGFTSPFPECGKTTCMDTLDYLCLRAVRGDNVSASTVFRVIDEHHPSFLLDELDTFIQKNPELVGVLNSGHKKGGYVWRTEKIDDKNVSIRFGTYAPVAYAMIGHPTGTMFSRTIFIRLERKKSNQVVEDFDPDENPEQAEMMTVLRRKMVRWAQDHRTEIKDLKPNTGSLSNRARNNWRPLLKIAEVVGGDWTSILLTAAGVPPPLNKKTLQEKLLRDIRNIFHVRKVDRLPSAVLVADLIRQEQSGWKRYHEGRDWLDEADLADLLIEFGVEPKPMKLAKDVQLKLFGKQKDVPVTKRGYLLEDFAPLIETYLSGEAEDVPVAKEVPF